MSRVCCTRAALAPLVAAIAVAMAFDLSAAPVVTSQPTTRVEGSPAAVSQDALRRYCVSCHNAPAVKAGRSPVALDQLDLSRVPERPDIWEKVLSRLRAGSMPPAGAPRPDATTTSIWADWLEAELDRSAAERPNPGRQPAVHRLNRAEYKNAVRDLIGLTDLPREFEIGALLPPDDVSYGFDNMSDALGTTPTLLERYLSAAQKLSALAIGDPDLPVIVDRYRVPLSLPQDDRFSDLPFGSRGGISVRRLFPLDGEYTIQLEIALGRTADQHQVEVALDGERIRTFAVGVGGERGRGGRSVDPLTGPRTGPLQTRAAIKAGTHELHVTFVKKTTAVGEDILRPFTRTGQSFAPAEPTLLAVTVSGPYASTGPGDTVSRRHIFQCRPATVRDETACAERILSTLARRAFRRPSTKADVELLLPFYRMGRDEGTFDRGIQRAVERLLVSPAFLFRIEREPSPVTARGGRTGDGTGRDAVVPISDLELASRLSFFLWSSLPDDELLELASRGRLGEPATLERQVARMLADPRAEALGDNFASQWFSLRGLEDVAPDPRLFPDFDESLRRSMRRETELFFESIVREDRSVLDLLIGSDTFINERLARHYGIRNIYGDAFRRVVRPDNRRRGVLGQASILTLTSYAHRTSPVLRGKWIMENVLGTPPPPPPPNVPTLVETNKTTGKTLTMREAMAQHRANPTCASCHARMDPLGFAFENFDAVGRWRTVSADAPVDASGALPDGTKFDGADGLLEVLMRQPERFASTVVERLLTYALGRGLEPFDAPTVRAITRRASDRGYRFSAMVTGVVTSVPFRMRTRPPAPPAESAAAADTERPGTTPDR